MELELVAAFIKDTVTNSFVCNCRTCAQYRCAFPWLVATPTCHHGLALRVSVERGSEAQKSAKAGDTTMRDGLDRRRRSPEAEGRGACSDERWTCESFLYVGREKARTIWRRLGQSEFLRTLNIARLCIQAGCDLLVYHGKGRLAILAFGDEL